MVPSLVWCNICYSLKAAQEAHRNWCTEWYRMVKFETAQGILTVLGKLPLGMVV